MHINRSILSAKPAPASRGITAAAWTRSLLTLALLTPPTHAQTPPTAPLPTAITSAHKLFLGNAGDQENADCLRAYNDLYADLTKLTRFTLVPSPGAADLILEMHYELTPGQTAGHDDPRRFRVLILDPATHVVLWSLVERTNYAVRQSKRDENLDEMVNHLAADFDTLTSAQPPSNNSRTQHGLIH